MDSSLAGQHVDTVALGIRQVLCTPLRVVHYVDQPGAPPEQRPIGVVYLDSREKGRLVSVETRHALEAFVTEAAAAIDSARLYRESAEKARLESELQLAAEIQRALLPEACRSGSHFDVASRSIPCRAIGGDFYDQATYSSCSVRCHRSVQCGRRGVRRGAAAYLSRREPTVFARGATRASTVLGAQLCIRCAPVRRCDGARAALQGHIADFGS